MKICVILFKLTQEKSSRRISHFDFELFMYILFCFVLIFLTIKCLYFLCFFFSFVLNDCSLKGIWHWSIWWKRVYNQSIRYSDFSNQVSLAFVLCIFLVVSLFPHPPVFSVKNSFYSGVFHLQIPFWKMFGHIQHRGGYRTFSPGVFVEEVQI